MNSLGFSLTKGQRSKRQTILSVLAVHRPFYISIYIYIYIQYFRQSPKISRGRDRCRGSITNFIIEENYNMLRTFTLWSSKDTSFNLFFQFNFSFKTKNDLNNMQRRRSGHELTEVKTSCSGGCLCVTKFLQRK